MRIAHAPTVDGTEICLRQIERADLAAWYAVLSDPSTVEHTSGAVTSPADLAKLFDAYLSFDPESNIRFAIVQPPGDELVGTIGFHSRSSLNRTAELAFDLKRSLWREGITPRFVRSVLGWGFSAFDLVRIQATSVDANVGSQRVLEKTGFAREGMLRYCRLIRGAPRDFLMYSVVPRPRSPSRTQS